jgi:hypothetical protein
LQAAVLAVRTIAVQVQVAAEQVDIAHRQAHLAAVVQQSLL